MRTMTVLMASRPLTKTFYPDKNNDPYPLVKEFTSTAVKYGTIQEMLEIMSVASTAGGCLLKGSLRRSIANESRAGLNDPSAETDWLVIDYDADAGFSDIDEMLAEIDPALADTDYIFQHSASAGLYGKPPGLRGHVFFLLSESVAPTLLKEWLRKVNLVSEKFSAHIRLSKNGMSLRYPLDVTVNQNDKLLYVAPPTLKGGLEDPLPDRFSLQIRDRRLYTFSAAVSREFNKTKEAECLARLRDKAGMAPSRPKYQALNGDELLLNPDECTVTGVKRDSMFTRVNLNGGDSWAYWFPNDNPEILYNFKGEPPMYLRDVAPVFYAQTIEAAHRQRHRPFVFRDTASDTYYNAEVDEETGRLVMCHPVARRQTLGDFMLQRGAPVPKLVPDWNVVFDPTNALSVDFQNKVLNLYTPTIYAERRDASSEPSERISVESIPSMMFPTIHKVTRHICVDEPTHHHFLKWLAHIIQFKTKTQTAWLFSGVEGTGKGVTYEHIMKPLFGADYCNLVNQSSLDEDFNGYAENNIILFVDEGDVESSRNVAKTMGKLRTLITEQSVPIRKMRQNVKNMLNFSNVIMATNQIAAVKIHQSDRRWNIAPRQETKISLTIDEIKAISDELPFFADCLHSLDIAPGDATHALANEAKNDLVDLGKTVADDFFLALITKNLDFFVERLLEQTPYPENNYLQYQSIIQLWMKDAIYGRHTEVSIDDLLTVYKYISGNDSITPKKFAYLSGRYTIERRRRRVHGVQKVLVVVPFKNEGYEEWFAHKEPQKPVLVNKINEAKL